MKGILFSDQDVNSLFEQVANVSARFVISPTGVELISDSNSAILNRDRVKIFQDLFEGLHKKHVLPSYVDFVVNFHDEPLIPHGLSCWSQPPIFSFCPGIGFSDLPMINDNVVAFRSSNSADIQLERPWSGRQDLAYWRGSTTGGWYTLDNWKDFSRSTLVRISKARPDILDASFVRCAQCDPGVWDTMQKEGLCESTETYPTDDILQRYKYLVDIDGNACSFRFIGMLRTGSVIFKVQPAYNEFFDTLLSPYVHYIPVSRDMSDLVAKLQWAFQHDKEMEQISKAAMQAYRDIINNRAWEDFLVSLLFEYQKLFDQQHQMLTQDVVS